MRLIHRLFDKPLTVLDLRGAAEMANDIEKYGRLGAMCKTLMKVSSGPRHNCQIMGITEPRDYV